MANRNNRAKWVLPAIINPSDSVDFCVPVPNDRQHIAAFRGAMQTLGSAIFWQDDDAHTAKDVAAVWRYIANNLEHCMACIDIMFRVSGGYIQESCDGGSTWSNVGFVGNTTQLKFRNNISNANLYDFSIDNGLTWQGMPNWISYYVKQVPTVTEPNLINATGTPGLQIETNSDDNPIFAQSNTNGSAATVLLSQNTGVDNPFVELQGDRGNVKFINKYMALQMVGLSAFPTPDATNEGMLGLQTGAGVDSVPKFIGKKADGTFAVQTLKGADGTNGTNGIDGATPGLFPDYPSTGFIEFYVWVLPDGVYFPYFLNAGDMLEVVNQWGVWWFNNGTDSYIVNQFGTDAISIGGFPAGGLMFAGYIIDAHGKISTSEPLAYFADGYTGVGSDIPGMLMNTDSGWITHGYLLAKIRLTRFSGPTYDWTISADFRITEQQFAAPVSGRPGLYWSDIGYGLKAHDPYYSTIVEGDLSVHTTGTDTRIMACTVQITSATGPDGNGVIIAFNGVTESTDNSWGIGDQTLIMPTFDTGVFGAGTVTVRFYLGVLFVDADGFYPFGMKTITLSGNGTPPTFLMP